MKDYLDFTNILDDKIETYTHGTIALSRKEKREIQKQIKQEVRKKPKEKIYKDSEIDAEFLDDDNFIAVIAKKNETGRL